MLTNPSFHRIDDQPILWEALERQNDGLVIAHASGGQRYVTRELWRLRAEFLKFAASGDIVPWSIFFIAPVGVNRVDVNLTRHEC